jgi:hypothetical protein
MGEGHHATAMNMRRLSFHIGIIGGFAVLAMALTYPLVLHMTTHIPSEEILPPSIAEHWIWTWGFWFGKQVVDVKRWSFFTDVIFYPRGVDLTYSVLFGLGLPVVVAVPFVRLLGLPLTFNLFLFIAFIVAAYATFLLVRDLTQDKKAAFVAGFIFAFSPYQMARTLAHFGIMTSVVWIPLYILFFMRAIAVGHLHNLILSTVILSLTFFINPYYAIFLVLFSIIYTIYYIISNRSDAIKAFLWTRLIPMWCFASLFSLPLLWITLTHRGEDFLIYAPTLQVLLWHALQHSADLLAFFVPSSHHSIWGDFVKPVYYSHFTGNPTEQTVYIGYTVLILSVIAIVKAPKEQTRFWLVSAVAFFVLSLGPFLHIYGKDTFELGGVSVWLPLPYYPMLFIPVLKAMRGLSRLSIMCMLALAVLAGYGITYLWKRFEGKQAAALGFLGLIIAIIGLEFSIVPIPLVDARIPKVYEGIAREQGQGGTILDVPLYWSVAKYQHYQTMHQKRLLFGQAPRLSLAVDFTYADAIPFVQLFKNPQLIKDYEAQRVDKGDVLRFIEFFDLSFIVIHKDLLAPWFFTYFVRHPWDTSPPSPTLMQAPEVFDRLMRFLMTYFPVAHVDEEGDIVVLTLARPPQADDLWMSPAGMRLDFDATRPQFFLTDGWSPPERWRDLTFAWAAAKESRLWAYLPRGQALAMEVRVQPFTFPGSPPQGMTIEVNGRVVSRIALATSAWQSHTVHLTPADLVQGINTFRFVYDHTAAPAAVWPGNGDQRQLAVNFDYIEFHLE